MIGSIQLAGRARIGAGPRNFEIDVVASEVDVKLRDLVEVLLIDRTRKRRPSRVRIPSTGNVYAMLHPIFFVLDVPAEGFNAGQNRHDASVEAALCSCIHWKVRSDVGARDIQPATHVAVY